MSLLLCCEEVLVSFPSGMFGNLNGTDSHQAGSPPGGPHFWRVQRRTLSNVTAGYSPAVTVGQDAEILDKDSSTEPPRISFGLETKMPSAMAVESVPVSKPCTGG